MLTKRRLKTLGCWASASEKVLPPSMAVASSPRMPLRLAFFSCFCSTRNPRNSGKPACTSVANCRVKVQRTFDLTRPLRPGILICKLTFIPPPFLPLAAAFLAALAGGAPLSSTTLVGKKPISLMRPMASFWLAASMAPLVSLPLESMAT